MTAPSSVPVSTFVSVDKDVRGSVLCLVIKALGRSLNINTFDERKVIQKLVFVAQRAGVPVGYSYRWHLSGPYSSDLSKTYYTIASNPEVYERQAAQYKLKPDMAQKLQDIRACLGAEIQNPEMLEAMASCLYLGSSSLDELSQAKPKIPLETWTAALHKLEALNLHP